MVNTSNTKWIKLGELVLQTGVIQNRTIPNKQNAGVAELVDAPDLGSGALMRGGSSPSTRTRK